MVHLWDCGSASSLCKIEDEANNVINACDLSSHQWQSDTVVDRSECYLPKLIFQSFKFVEEIM